jgi:triphosphoribosyl-dephospho-CoA synthase
MQRRLPHKPALGPGAAATLACLYEATSPKPGNVHPSACFCDVAYDDFVASAVVVGPVIDRAREAGVGKTVLDAVCSTRAAVGTNTNLGTLLLVAPLAAVPAEESLSDGIQGVLTELTSADTRCVYEAIRLAQAGGLGRADEADVFADVPSTLTLVETMSLAADRDYVARQYTNNFKDVFAGPAERIAEGLQRGWPLSQSIVHAHVRQLAAAPDSLIGRKCGAAIADESKNRASQVLAAGTPGQPEYERTLADLDAWLRADGHRRNPGTTADLIAAGLFVLLREGRLDWSAW